VTQLGQVVKDSAYSVYTRVNVVGDAKPVTENERLRTDGGLSIDFFGNDPYTSSNDFIYSYGTDAFWSQGNNFPMIMENFGGHASADIHKFNATAGNTAYNYYAALDPDSSTGSSDFGLYDFDPETKVVTRKDVSVRVATLNHMLNKISRDLATRRPIEAGGTTMQTFNRNAAANVDITKPLDDLDVGFATSDGGQGIAVKRNSSEIALLSTRAATFTLPASYGAVKSVENGHYDSDDEWVSAGSKDYDTPDGDIAITLNEGECVRVTFDPS
jgi:hypothetical protein